MSDEIAGLKILELPYEFPQNLENESAQLPFAIPNGSNARTGLAELKENFLEGARTALANETARAEAAEQENANAISAEAQTARAAEAKDRIDSVVIVKYDTVQVVKYYGVEKDKWIVRDSLVVRRDTLFLQKTDSIAMEKPVPAKKGG